MNDELIELKEKFEQCQRKHMELSVKSESLKNEFEKQKTLFKTKLSELGLKNSKELDTKIEELKEQYEIAQKKLSDSIGEISGLIRTATENR